MNFKEYQLKAKETAIYPDNVAAVYLALGVAGEAGEVVEEVKKSIRNGKNVDGSDFDQKRLDNLFEEMGDVLWYLANLSTTLGFDLDAIAAKNIHKLQKRHGFVE